MRAILALVTAAALVLLTGCGTFIDPTEAAPTRWLEPPTVSPQAHELYSTEEIESAYQELTTLTFERSFEPALLDPQRTLYTPDELNAGLFERMTPALQKHWSDTVAAGLAGNADEKDNTRILRFFDWEQPTWRLPPSGAGLVHQSIRDVEIEVVPAAPGTEQQLQITLIIDAFMQFEHDGATFPITVSKRITHWLVPAEDSAPFDWRLYAYEGVFAVDEDLPVESDTQTELPPPPDGAHPGTAGAPTLSAGTNQPEPAGTRSAGPGPSDRSITPRPDPVKSANSVRDREK